LHHRLSFILVLVSVAAAQTSNPEPLEPSSWLAALWNLPVIRFLFPGPEPLTLAESAPPPAPQFPGCSVSPLTELSDVPALTLEAEAGSAGVVIREGLTPRTAEALEDFESNVTRAGGRIEIKSAYRPAAYQDHLQNVWDKWMLELRNNRSGPCAGLKAIVRDEFVRHELLESQRPVPVSDHTLGIGFDAAVALPRAARLNRRRVSIDSLARLSGIVRPAIRRDPVHFRVPIA
jgi:hypothetical protein